MTVTIGKRKKRGKNNSSIFGVFYFLLYCFFCYMYIHIIKHFLYLLIKFSLFLQSDLYIFYCFYFCSFYLLNSSNISLLLLKLYVYYRYLNYYGHFYTVPNCNLPSPCCVSLMIKFVPLEVQMGGAPVTPLC